MKINKNLHEISVKDRTKLGLSVIIPTLNEIAYLPSLLDALDLQTRLPDEVIVADAGSVDGTAELARTRGARVIHGGMPAVGRNAGAHVAKGDLLLFLDADVLPPPDFIARSLEEFERKEYDVATCFNFYFMIIQPISPHAPGFCILSKRATHQKMGGFDESLTLSEDIDYARRAKKTGKFGILTSAHIPVSMRRVGKEGLVGLGLKYAWCEMYAMVGKPVREVPFEYEFGTFGPSQASTSWTIFKKDIVNQQWKKFVYPLQRISRNIREKLNP